MNLKEDDDMRQELLAACLKRFFLAAVMMCCMTAFFSSAAAAEDAAVDSLEDVYITGFMQADMAQELHWAYEDMSGYGQGRCFFLPAGADANQAVIWFARKEKNPATGEEVSVQESGYVTIDGQKVKSGDKIELPKAGNALSIMLAGGKETKINICKSANVPSMFIATQSKSLESIHADKDYKEKGDMLLVKADGTADFDGALKHIKGRGNVTWEYEKRPYNIKLDQSADLLGMGKAKGWCLLANYLDTSLLRNRVAYDLAEETGIDFTMDTRQLDLYINGEYKGTYLLTEKVEIDKNRVNLTDMEKATEDANGPDADLESYPAGGTNAYKKNTRKWREIPNDPDDITGGYLIEVELNDRYAAEACGFVTTIGQAVTMKAPEFVSKNQIDYIAEFYQDMEDALYAKTGYNSKGKHFSEYIDEESIAKMYLLQEYCLNLDSGITSFYLYKDSDLTGDGKLHMAPVWDFDIALGNHPGRDGVDLTSPNVWWANRAQIYNVGGLNLLAQAVQYDSVKKQVIEQWNDVFRPAVLYLLGQNTEYQAKKLKKLAEYQSEVSVSAEMNFMVWPKALGHLITGVWSGENFAESVTYLKNFLSQREIFLDRAFAYGASSGYNRLTGTVTLSGTMKAGETLTAVVEDSNAENFTYQWFADKEEIAGATAQSYVLKETDVGKVISVAIKASDGTLLSSLTQTSAEPVKEAGQKGEENKPSGGTSLDSSKENGAQAVPAEKKKLPDAPKKLKAKAKKGRQVVLSWKKVKGASEYRIYRANSKNGKYKLIKKIKKQNITKYTDKKKLKKNKTYYYKIAAVKDGICGSPGKAVKVKVKK